MPIPGLTRRRQTFFLTVVKPADLRSGPDDRYAFRGTMGTRDEAVARIKALAIRADLETQWQAERDRRRPQPSIAPTPALVDMLAERLRHVVLTADDQRRASGHLVAAYPLQLPGMEAAADPFEQLAQAEMLEEVYAKALALLPAVGGTGMVQALANAEIRTLGLPPIDWTGQSAALLKLARAYAEAHADAAKRSKGENIQTPPAPQIVATAPAPGPALDWSTLLADWIAAQKRTTPAIKITERAIRLFTESVGAVDIHQLDRSHAAKYRAALVAQSLKGRSIKNLLSPLVALLNLAIDSGKLKMNPWHGVKVNTSDSTKRLPWRLEQLKALAAVNNTREDAGRWLLPLLLYTGCRIGELAQLELSDIREIDGEYAIEVHQIVTAGHELRTVKTDAGLRTIPVAPALLAMGFRAHVEAMQGAGERFLFPKFIQAGKKRPSELAGRYFLV